MNGWRNRATWNVNLWLMNDEGNYREVRKGRPHSAATIKTIAYKLFPSGRTPDGYHLNDDIDWREIAEGFINS